MKHTYDSLLDNASKEELKKIDIIGVNPMYPDVFKLGKNGYILPRYPDSGANLFFEFFKIQKIYLMTPTVTNMALALGINLGFKEIYLFGTDMGFRDEKEHHIKDSIYYKEKSEFKTDKMEIYKEVDGNFEGRVYTTQIFEMARKGIESLLAANPNVNVYNTADGAKIKGAKPLKIKDLKIKTDSKKEEAIKTIKSKFSKELYSEKFNEFINKRLKKILSKIDEIKDFIEKTIDLKDFSEESYQDELIKLYEKFEKEFSSKDNMVYILFRGTLYHMLSFHYFYIIDLKDKSKQAKFAQNFKEDLLNFLDESKKRLKNIFTSPIIKV